MPHGTSSARCGQVTAAVGAAAGVMTVSRLCGVVSWERLAAVSPGAALEAGWRLVKAIPGTAKPCVKTAAAETRLAEGAGVWLESSWRLAGAASAWAACAPRCRVSCRVVAGRRSRWRIPDKVAQLNGSLMREHTACLVHRRAKGRAKGQAPSERACRTSPAACVAYRGPRFWTPSPRFSSRVVAAPR